MNNTYKYQLALVSLTQEATKFYMFTCYVILSDISLPIAMIASAVFLLAQYQRGL